jgi:hypothetical protein
MKKRSVFIGLSVIISAAAIPSYFVLRQPAKVTFNSNDNFDKYSKEVVNNQDTIDAYNTAFENNDDATMEAIAYNSLCHKSAHDFETDIAYSFITNFNSSLTEDEGK